MSLQGHQILVLSETDFKVVCSRLVSNRNFGSLGRELGTRRRQQDYGEGFRSKS